MDKSEGFMADDTEQDNGIIELTQVVGKNASDLSDPDVIELTDIEIQAGPEKGGGDTGLELDTPAKDTGGILFPLVESAITREQLDAALERVIEKEFGTQIEGLVFEVMEKVLERELVNIRKRLQKDLDALSVS